jgi:hypothetical protein
MNTLIIHPSDPSTDFLCPIYKSIKNKEVIRGGITKQELLKAVHSHERIMMLGHGSPGGLFAVGQFEQEAYMSYIVDDSFVPALQQKDNVYIWCHANQFVEKHNLKGFYSGMFISEVQEAILYDYSVSQEIVTYSNDIFSEIVGKHITYPSDILHKKVRSAYGKGEKKNPIIAFNNERLQYNAS